MSFLLRSSLTILIGTMAFSGYAQTGSAAIPAATTTPDSALLAPAAYKAAAYKTAAYKAGPYKAYLTQRYAQDAEARAVVHLFSRKQNGGGLWLLAGATSIGLIASQTGTKTTDSGTTTFIVTPLGYGLLLGLFGGVGVGKMARFSNKNLYEALAEYERSRSLPAYVTKRIKAKDRH